MLLAFERIAGAVATVKIIIKIAANNKAVFFIVLFLLLMFELDLFFCVSLVVFYCCHDYNMAFVTVEAQRGFAL